MTYCAISVSAGSNLVSLCHPTHAFYIFKMSQLKSLFLPSIGQNHPSKEKRWKVKAAINHTTTKSNAFAVSIMYSRIHPDCVCNCHSILKTMSRIPLTCLIQCNQNNPDVFNIDHASDKAFKISAKVRVSHLGWASVSKGWQLYSSHGTSAGNLKARTCTPGLKESLVTKFHRLIVRSKGNKSVLFRAE